MIRSKRVNGYSDNAVLSEFYGLSTDTKPTENVATGSVFTEVDTGKTFLYDEESEDWTEVESGSGGGGGGDSDFSTAEVTIVNNGDMATTLYIPNADELTGTPFSPSCVSDAYIPIGETITIKAVLYKGRVMTPMLPNIEATGNATIDNSMLIISGDCTITIS